MKTTDTVLDHHLSAFTQQDLSGIMEDYTDESVIVTNIGTFGKMNGIERLFGDLFADFSQDGTTIDVTQTIVKREFAYIVWHAETPENVYEFAANTFYIPEETIEFQTMAVDISPNT